MAWQGNVPGAFPNGGGNDHPSYSFPPLPPQLADFFRLMGPGGPGEGVDHVGPTPPTPAQFPPGFPFGGRPPWGGRRGRDCRRRGGPCRGGRPGHRPNPPPGDDDSSPHDPNDTPREGATDEDDDTMKDDPPEVPPEDDEPESPPPYGGPRGPHHGPHGHRRGGHGHPRGGRHGPFGGPHHGPHHGGRHGRGPPPHERFGFDPSTFFRQFVHHPWAHNLCAWLESSRFPHPPHHDNDHFTPPLDVFENEREYVLHLAVPGAKKEDVHVHWNADKSHIDISGIIHRPGDEEFLRGLVSSERRVGYFERTVKLPPEDCESNDEVDGLGISAKMEDGVLIVVVPKSEKEWTEVHKVDIE
ncbi:hypothetical protein jhhlp_001342 [Lomentospora prolificans]|uniref:SHSP domain-containing protein n=1 Tax=Lomentospora prolificans TaxID=41688 RepID=A0A2N3NHV4_9PEZI|nr:hypothetical protein jhhlp_001342 [Lomentospora prolificans]